MADSSGLLRRSLDAIYTASGALAVTFLVLIAVLTLAQIIARLLGTIVPSADDFAGFAMAGAVFLGFAYTLRAGAQVRMLVVLNRLPRRARTWAEGICAGGAAALVGYMIHYTIDMVLTTNRMGERTLGLVPIPKWIPMLLMLTGLAVLFIALIDDLARIVRGRKPLYAVHEDPDALPVATAE